MKNKILILEDDPIIAHDIELILSQDNFEIASICHSATKAIDAIGKYEINGAILDINLGGSQTGLDVAKVIHDKKLFPFIFLTSYSDKTTLSAAKDLNPYGYLVKPFQEATLLTTLSLAISNFQHRESAIDWSKKNVTLTNQEKEICSGFALGKSYQECADDLFISINTVRYHAKNLYQNCKNLTLQQ